MPYIQEIETAARECLTSGKSNELREAGFSVYSCLSTILKLEFQPFYEFVM